MDLGAVLDIQDVAGGKVCALASRVEPRDDADTAAMLGHCSPAELITLARRLDSGLGARDFADAGALLDQIDNEAFTRYGLTARDVTTLRQFAAWPRTPEDAEKLIQANPTATHSQAQADRKSHAQAEFEEPEAGL